MTKDYLDSVMSQLQAQKVTAANQAQAVEGAIQLLTQLIAAEAQLAAGGTLPPQGITGPSFA